MNRNKYIDGLAYDLLSYYGFKTITSEEFNNKKHTIRGWSVHYIFVAKPKGPGIAWNYDEVFMFNNGYDVLQGINKFILGNSSECSSWNYKLYRKLSKKLIKFKECGDLDVQLALLGYRKSIKGVKTFAS